MSRKNAFNDLNKVNHVKKMPPHPRIGLFGGTFDPIHDGHIHLATLAREALSLDEVRFIPCQISPHKPGSQPTSGADRHEMLRRALSNIPWATLDDRELKSGGPSYSYKTAKSISEEFPSSRLFWIMGADQWQTLPKWREPETLAALVEFIVLARNGQNPAPRAGYRMHTVHGEHPASATVIRKAVGSGQKETPWLHPQVSEWIKTNGLYQHSPA